MYPCVDKLNPKNLLPLKLTSSLSRLVLASSSGRMPASVMAWHCMDSGKRDKQGCQPAAAFTQREQHSC